MNIISAQTTTASVLMNLTSSGFSLSSVKLTDTTKVLTPPITLVANGLANVEIVAVEVSSDEGVTYAPALDSSTGTPIELSATKNVVNINSFGRYKIVKGVTVAAVAVSVSNVANL